MATVDSDSSYVHHFPHPKACTLDSGICTYTMPGKMTLFPPLSNEGSEKEVRADLLSVPCPRSKIRPRTDPDRDLQMGSHEPQLCLQDIPLQPSA